MAKEGVAAGEGAEAQTRTQVLILSSAPTR